MGIMKYLILLLLFSFYFIIINWTWQSSKTWRMIRKKWNPNKCSENTEDYRLSQANKDEGCSSERQKEGLMVKIKLKSNLLELSTVSNIHYRPGNEWGLKREVVRRLSSGCSSVQRQGRELRARGEGESVWCLMKCSNKEMMNWVRNGRVV